MTIRVLTNDLKKPEYYRGLTAGQQLERELVIRILEKELKDYKRGDGVNYAAELRRLIQKIGSRA
jgi:hypothetical protein